MNLLKGKKKSHSIFSSPALAIIIAILAFWAGSTAWSAFLMHQKSLEELKRDRDNLTKIETREESLSHRLDELASPLGIERELRHRFPVTKDGEKMVVLYEKENEELPPSSPKKEGFWEDFSEKIGAWLR